MIFTPNPAATATDVEWTIFYTVENEGTVRTMRDVWAADVEHALWKAGLDLIARRIEWVKIHAEAIRA